MFGINDYNKAALVEVGTTAQWKITTNIPALIQLHKFYFPIILYTKKIIIIT